MSPQQQTQTNIQGSKSSSSGDHGNIEKEKEVGVVDEVPASASASATLTPTPHDPSHTHACDDRIHGLADVWQAVKLAWRRSRRHLLVTWLHVPLGCCFICVVCWSLDLLLDLAPFSFPGPVLGTVVFFVLLLLLDWLSDKFPGKGASQGADADVEANAANAAADDNRRKPKRFVDPVMAVLAPPCDFLLRNMSVLFTPSFILIPARESIPGKEIGLLAAWFAITQVIGFVIPILIVRGLDWMYGTPKKVKALREKREKRRLLKERRQQQHTRSHRGSVATLQGMDFEKRIPYGGGEKLGIIATGLSGVTAVVVAPVSHVDMTPEAMSPDMRRHISGVALETARQQGEPMPQYTTESNGAFLASDVSAFQHNVPHHHRLHGAQHNQDGGGAAATRPRDRRRSRSVPAVVERRRRPQSGGRDAAAAAAASPLASPRRRRDASCPGDTDTDNLRPPKSADRPSSARSNTSTGTTDTTSRSRSPFRRGRRVRTADGGPSHLRQRVDAEDEDAAPQRPNLSTQKTDPTSTMGLFDPAFSFDRDVGGGSGRLSPAGVDTDANSLPSPGVTGVDIGPTEIALPPRVFFDDHLQTASERRRQEEQAAADAIQIEADGNAATAAHAGQRGFDSTGANTAVNSLRPSVEDGVAGRHNSVSTVVARGDEGKKNKSGDDDEDEDEEEEDDDDDDEDDDSDSASSASSYGPDAIERLASWISDLLTPTIYALLFIVGLPIFFLLDFALPLHLAINILTFWLAINVVPAKLRRYAHPILTTSLLTVLIIWAFGAMRGLSLKEELSYYERRAKFNILWNPAGYHGPAPGAGDILSSLLDAGIVALFVPLYRYRKDLKACGLRLCIALLPCALLSLFVWPTIASLMGLDKIRALAFAARFLSTPLAIQLVDTLGGDQSITVILVVLTGIIAAIFKEPFFKLMRVDMDDHLTIGVTFGATSGAIGASSLIARPRVMALASLGFVIFGAMCLIGAAIPPLVDFIGKLATV